MKVYDLIIIGAGPAGLSAGIYAGRAMLDTVILEKGQDGGQILQTAEIDNYPGSGPEESGATLIDRMAAQVKKFGVEKIYDDVTAVSLDGDIKEIICQRETYRAKTVIIAGGASAKPIGCIGEDKFIGRGISHCATCDGPFFRNLEVFVIGGGDAALEEAMFLTKFAKKVTVVHRRRILRAAKSVQEKTFKNDKISFLYHTVVKEIKGEDLIESMILENVKDGSITEIKADPNDGTFGVFVFIGYDPSTQLYQGKLTLNEKGYIITDENMKTNLSGVYAAGDIREKSLRQVVTAAADGAIAAVQAGKYIEELESK
ncbi:thioredoxin-disulfide reductase [Sinanaerobacter chloroacetimidivorans]|uniref:Thioredoxin reductase n=1 Tax=Sinanaerobacter chloroacetimidivorans TaxID=2818044 RepID=A0A8J7VZD3_9FIRM|nr:thioredoxin-disulfide reductase [Sinanaerobacter chloroacetimidivorans]MBR0597471.1 thioredoxin-disulfide reductase [Sinanaerobacter chloroacetimidivorans]